MNSQTRIKFFFSSLLSSSMSKVQLLHAKADCFSIVICLYSIILTSSINTVLTQYVESSSISSDVSTLSPKQTNEYRASLALEVVGDWASRFGRDIHYGTQEAICLRSIRDQFDPAKSDPSRMGDNKASVVSIDWTRTHAEIVKTISNTMSWHKSAVEAIARESEYLAGNHTYDKNLTYVYVDVHRLHNVEEEEDPSYDSDQMTGQDGFDSNNNINGSPINIDDSLQGPGQDSGQLDANGQYTGLESEPPPEPLPQPSALQSNQSLAIGDPSGSISSSGEWQTPVKYLQLSKHRNFDDVLINTEESAVHIPVHIFPGESQIMNGIAWSDQLTKVFRDNFVRNPKLTNQYFASWTGFMRLFPAQKWQIARTDPDLYDARMRPWYVAGASSRKDVIILVDSSGSMTGSRRDIAKGVVFEILDTLTDNDHFLILKFSDTVQQVGVPTCSKLRMKRRGPSIPLINTVMLNQDSENRDFNETDINSFYLTPANGRNIRHIKTNFTISTSGIANFSRALITAFEVLRNYQDNELNLGSQCNQAIMLVTDGSPSDFEDIFNRYNYPNAPVRVFTYLIGREAGDEAHTKMMACHNRGYYTHVINLAEVRETVQQYIPVMARPLVLNGTHPITWTPAYGELTYQILTDWIWESKRREKAKAILAANNRGSPSSSNYVPDIKVTSDDESVYSPSLEEELEAIDLFGYNSNIDCFWETRRNDLLTTVVQPVYDRKNESIVTEKFLLKNVWTIKETVMRTAQILGVAAADMKINDIIALAPSHKLGANGYAVMLTNNGFAMHHPDLRSILEPFSSDPSEKNMRILKPFFSSLDFTQVEHILNPTSDDKFLALRKEAVAGLTGWRELLTKRTVDCQKRVQTRTQNFYYKPIQQVPFSFMVAIPQPYGSHRVQAQVKIKSSSLPERLTTYFTNSDYDLWTVHPDYQYCDGPSNNTVTTLLDVFQRVEAGKLDDIQWRPAESSKPPLFLPGKIVCDKDLVQSLVYDAVATFGFSDTCAPPSSNAE